MSGTSAFSTSGSSDNGGNDFSLGLFFGVFYGSFAIVLLMVFGLIYRNKRKQTKAKDQRKEFLLEAAQRQVELLKGWEEEVRSMGARPVPEMYPDSQSLLFAAASLPGAAAIINPVVVPATGSDGEFESSLLVLNNVCQGMDAVPESQKKAFSHLCSKDGRDKLQKENDARQILLLHQLGQLRMRAANSNAAPPQASTTSTWAQVEKTEHTALLLNNEF